MKRRDVIQPGRRVRILKSAALKPFLRLLVVAAGISLALETPIAFGNVPAVAASTTPAIAYGDTKPLGAGSVVAWIKSDGRGHQTSFGISFDDAALTRLKKTPTEIVLALPSARGLPFRSAVIDWNPHGHPPAHVYTVPHFDFHFYSIGESTRMAIAPFGPSATATPAPDLIPTGFVTGGSTVPMMGKHYVFRGQPEFHGGTFTATPIYGYWNGHLAFVESMITLAYLRSHPAISRPLPLPARFEQNGTYPTQWAIDHDARKHRYTLTFTKLLRYERTALLSKNL